MISELKLQNFRGFDEHVVDLLPTTIVVGRNNAGKSTIVEALRLVSLVVTHCKNRNAISRKWELSRAARAVKRLAPSLQLYEVETSKRVFYHYREPPARITATFSSGAEIAIQIWEDKLTATINASSVTQLTYVSNLPQVAPLALEEKKLNPETVRGAMSSTLASQHFRNQIYLLRELFSDFKTAAEATWHGLQIKRPEENVITISESQLTMMVRDGDFEAEVAWMGHGLQMWLQTMWFLTRVREHETVILDEPDVYMHADLQRKLIRLLKGKHAQVIVATHSPEIMAEVEPESILIINRDRPRSTFATDLPVAQKLLLSLGSVHNIQLARLATARRFLFVEGDDIGILKRFQDTLFLRSEVPIDTISMPLQGWGGWNYAIGSAQFLEKAGANVVCYTIFDADYHTPEDIEKRYDDAKQRRINLHIWAKKEIENYLLVPPAVARIIRKRSPHANVDELDIVKKIDSFVEALKVDTIAAIGSEIQKNNRGKEWGTVAKEATKKVEDAWNTQEQRWGVVSGKEVFARLSDWCNTKFNVSLSTASVARALTSEEISQEVRAVLAAVEHSEPFSLRTP